MILPDLAIPETFFEGVGPIIDTDGAGKSWSNMQEWADISFHPEPLDKVGPEDVENETKAAGGIHFCCYGMVSLDSTAHEKSQLMEQRPAFRCFGQTCGRHARLASQDRAIIDAPVPRDFKTF